MRRRRRHLAAPRTNEIGIRIALGADTGRVIGMVVRQGVVLTVIGIGAAASLLLTRMLVDLLFGVTARHPLTIFAVESVPSPPSHQVEASYENSAHKIE